MDLQLKSPPEQRDLELRVASGLKLTLQLQQILIPQFMPLFSYQG